MKLELKAIVDSEEEKDLLIKEFYKMRQRIHSDGLNISYTLEILKENTREVYRTKSLNL